MSYYYLLLLASLFALERHLSEDQCDVFGILYITMSFTHGGIHFI